MDAIVGLLERSGNVGNNLILAVNDRLSLGGLAVTSEEMEQLVEWRTESLAAAERIEFGMPAIVGIAEALATSPYLEQGALADALSLLQETFYELRSDIESDVPDCEIFEALRHCFDACGGDAAEVASLSVGEVMLFSNDYLHSLDGGQDEDILVVDDEGRAYALAPANWSYDEYSDGWDGERWSDDWDD